MPSVYIVEGNAQYHKMFHAMGWKAAGGIEAADLVQFTGGEDVTPGLYGERKHPQTGNNPRRDQYEGELFNRLLAMGKPMAGICRGGQFLNVMSGGAMWQHINGHAIHGTHPCIDNETGEVVQVTSTHHQMMRPNESGLILGQAYEAIRLERMDGDKVVVHKDDPKYAADVEVVFYPEQRTLCFQPHPEFPGYEECRDWYFSLINRHLGLKV